ncbi:MAG: hypothetical protein HON77_08030 [Gammaproteobacteria bacterium]|nr:hypothetical protein [Gammaproteobacteria bacterium]
MVKNRTVGPRNAAQGWEAYAVQENSPNAFSGIFVAEPGARYGNVYPFDSLLVDCPECWMSGNQLHVVREAPVMVETAMPLLRISKTIKLVDPYFTFFDFETWDRYRPLLLELFNRSSEYNFGRGNDRLEIHTSDKWGSMAPQLRKFVDSELAAGCSIKVYHWPHSEIHDRFILTDLGGLSFGHGLDEHTFNNAREVLVTVLDRAAYKRELRKTLRAAPPLTYSYPEV